MKLYGLGVKLGQQDSTSLLRLTATKFSPQLITMSSKELEINPYNNVCPHNYIGAKQIGWKI